MDCALELIRRNHNINRTCRLLRLENLRLSVLLKRPKNCHNGRVSVDESKQRWCSDGLGFKCFNGKTVSMTFVLDCRDREAISFVAKKGKRLPTRTGAFGCQ